MKARFAGESGRKILVETLMNQRLIRGNVGLAEKIADFGELVEVDHGTTIIEQGKWDTDVYLILLGSFNVLVNGRQVALRGPNSHVGEMAAIGLSLPRSASVISQGESLVCKLSEVQLAEVGRLCPDIWCSIARELAHRLMQRNNLVAAVRTTTRVFIISSVEALDIARAIQTAFEYDPFSVVVWTDGVFRVSQYPMESLERQLDQSDFAIAVVQPDDITQSRGHGSPSPRDNVVFELGYFMGRLGRHRTFLVEPRETELKLPTDLLGINTVRYKYTSMKDLEISLAPACNQIRKIIKEIGRSN
jgi:CRP/FNR family cyclic AMP-dependent transcriptional regulator